MFEPMKKKTNKKLQEESNLIANKNKTKQNIIILCFLIFCFKSFDNTHRSFATISLYFS